MGNPWENLTQAAGNLRDSVGQTAHAGQQLWDSTAGHAVEAARNVNLPNPIQGNTLVRPDLWQAGTEGVSNLAQSAGQGLGQLRDGVTQAAGATIDGVSQALAATVESAPQAVANTVETVTQLPQHFAHATEQFASAATDTATNVGEQLSRVPEA
ncbi:MAG: hypothetical protein ACRD3W_12530, partial [Terriglobales bacterium]